MSTSSVITTTAAASRSAGMTWSLVSLLFTLLAGGCTTIPVSVDFDPSVSFSEFGSFAFLPDPPAQGSATQLHNGLVDGRVQHAIRQELTARGFEELAADKADILVSHHIGTERGFDVRTVQTTHRYNRRGWSMSGGSQTTVREYERGTLLIDILLPADRTLVWRGSASGRLRETSDPAKREQRINDVVARILDRFPPQ